MSDNDVKAPNPLAGVAEQNPAEDQAHKVFQLAEKLIRALDEESAAHMEQISAADKINHVEES